METSWLNDLNLTRCAQEGKELQSNELNLCPSIPVWGCKNEWALKRRNDPVDKYCLLFFPSLRIY